MCTQVRPDLHFASPLWMRHVPVEDLGSLDLDNVSDSVNLVGETGFAGAKAVLEAAVAKALLEAAVWLHPETEFGENVQMLSAHFVTSDSTLGAGPQVSRTETFKAVYGLIIDPSVSEYAPVLLNDPRSVAHIMSQPPWFQNGLVRHVDLELSQLLIMPSYVPHLIPPCRHTVPCRKLIYMVFGFPSPAHGPQTPRAQPAILQALGNISFPQYKFRVPFPANTAFMWSIHVMQRRMWTAQFQALNAELLEYILGLEHTNSSVYKSNKVQCVMHQC